MKKCTLLFLLANILYLSALAQKYQLSGDIYDEKNKPLDFVSITIYPLTDSTNVRGTISNSTGEFILKNLPATHYKMIVQMLGYQDWEQELWLNQNTHLEKIIMEEEATVLAGIEVVAQQSVLENRLGKKVLRIGQDLAATGSNALDALDNIPSISTTQQGQIQIRGNSNVIIYINGKETRRDPTTLKFVAAEVLEKIEVITNPSSQYDAEGVGGIINLVYKKGKNGQFKLEAITNLSILTDPLNLNPNGGVNISFNKDKCSFFANISSDYGNYENYSDAVRTHFNDDLRLYENQIILEGKGLVNNYNMGISLEPDSTLSMGLEVNYDYWDFRENARQTSWFSYQDDIAEMVRLGNEIQELENELWLNYSLEKSFKSNTKLKISLTGGGEDELNTSQSDEVDISTLPATVQQFLLSSEETEKQRYYQSKVDYSTPFFNFGKIEAGIKADFIRYNILQQAVLRSETIKLPDNDFTMDMQKLGVYLLQSHQISKMEYSLGLRVEQFSSKALQEANQSTFTQDYLRFFPSIQVNYLLPDKSHTLGFNYTRRINRPRFFDLNPFVSYEDPLNLETGNPALRPEIANLYELTYHKEMNKWSVDLTLYRRTIMDAIQDNITLLSDDQTLTTTINLGQQINQGIEGQFEYRFNKSIKSTANITASQVKFFDPNYEITFDQQRSWRGRLKQQFQLPNNWKIELSETYRAPSYQAQRKSHEQFYMNIAINKKINHKRGAISLSIRDIFNTREYIYSLHTSSFEVQKNYKWQTRQVILGFRYNIFNG